MTQLLSVNSEFAQGKVGPKYKELNLPRTRVKCDIVILIDSNRRFINKKRLSPNQKVYMLPCGSINQVKKILSDLVFFGQHTLVLHFGVNDFETMSPQESCKSMRNVLLLCKEKFKTEKVIVSGITPRKDELNSEVKLANQSIMNEISKEPFKDIIYVENSNLQDDPSLLHDKKEWRKGVKIIDDKNESFIWWKMSKEFFNFSNDIYVCSTYIPPSNSSREKNVQTDHFRTLNETITKYRNLGKVILCGDFNSRVGILRDFISEKEQNPEFDIYYEFTQNTIPRISKDKNINSYGRKLIEICVSHNLRIANGRINGDS